MKLITYPRVVYFECYRKNTVIPKFYKRKIIATYTTSIALEYGYAFRNKVSSISDFLLYHPDKYTYAKY